jgi:hypothetical protein
MVTWGKLGRDGNVKSAADAAWGYIDTGGKVVISFKFSAAEPFSEGLAAVQLSKPQDGGIPNGYGFIDHSGTLRIPAKYFVVGAFSEGLALVQNDNKVGYIDKTGFMAVEAKFAPGSQPFSEGVAAVVAEDGKSGFIDRYGNWLIPPRYRNASSFHDGLAAVDGSYIDHSGKTVAGPFTQAMEFSEGLAFVISNGKPAYIDVHGKVLFTLGEGIAGRGFSDGVAAVSRKTGSPKMTSIGYIDRTGEFVIPLSRRFDLGGDFRGGLAFAAGCGQTGYIAKDGRPVFGLTSGAAGAATQSPPPPVGITPALIERISHHPGPLTIKEAAVSGACEGTGKKLWSVVADAADGTFRPLRINLLQGGSFLSDEKLGNLKAFEKQMDQMRQSFREKAQKEYAEMARRLPKTDPNLQAVQRNIDELAKPLDAGMLRAISRNGFEGYVEVLGVGPGGSSWVASVFSPDHQYEIQVELDIANYGTRFHTTQETKDYAQRVWNPAGLISDAAVEIGSLLFASNH